MKQLKVRYGTFSYDADNVIVYEIEKTDAFLQFVFRGYSTEKEHLKKPGDNESEQRDCLILQLSQSGKSVREIASQVNCGKSTVSRIIQRSKEDRNAAWDSMGQMGQAGQQEKQGRRSCLQDMKRRTNHEKAACTRLYASRPYHLQNMGAYKPGPDFPECPGVSQVSHCPSL